MNWQHESGANEIRHMEWLERPVTMKTLLLAVGAIVVASVVGWSRNSSRIDRTEEAVESLPDAIEAIREATEAMNNVSQSVTLNVTRPRTRDDNVRDVLESRGEINAD